MKLRQSIGVALVTCALAATAAAEPLLIDRRDAERMGMAPSDLAVAIEAGVPLAVAVRRLVVEAERKQVEFLSAVRIYRNVPGGWQCDAPVLFRLGEATPQSGETTCKREPNATASHDWIVARGFRKSAHRRQAGPAVAPSRRPQTTRRAGKRLSKRQLRKLVRQLE